MDRLTSDLPSSLVDLSDATVDTVRAVTDDDLDGATRRILEHLLDTDRSHAGFNSSL
jgi:hypothetical protein